MEIPNLETIILSFHVKFLGCMIHINWLSPALSTNSVISRLKEWSLIIQWETVFVLLMGRVIPDAWSSF